MTAAQLKEWAIVALVVGGIAFCVIEYKAIEHKGAIKVLTAQLDSAGRADTKKATQDSLIAARALQDAERLKSHAMALVVKQRADSARQDSLVRQSANERADAERVLRVSLSSAADLRSALERTIAQSRSDSSHAQQRHEADGRTISALLATITADSTALQRAGTAYNALLKRAVDSERSNALLKQSVPSGFSKMAWGLAGAGIGFLAGQHIH